MRVKLEPETAFIGKKFAYIFLGIIFLLNEITFIWLFLLILITVFVTYFYDLNKKKQISFLQKSFDNVYLQKSINSLTSKLKPRYLTIEYIIQKGDTYESILNNINIPGTEKKIVLELFEKD